MSINHSFWGERREELSKESNRFLALFKWCHLSLFGPVAYSFFDTIKVSINDSFLHRVGRSELGGYVLPLLDKGDRYVLTVYGLRSVTLLLVAALCGWENVKIQLQDNSPSCYVPTLSHRNYPITTN